MDKLSYPFYKIPKVVFGNPNLSPCAKLLFSYLLSRESYNIDYYGTRQGGFVQCYYRTLANKLGKSIDSVRKNYIPELISAGFLEKKTIGGAKGDTQSTMCLFSIRWENIVNDNYAQNVDNNL